MDEDDLKEERTKKKKNERRQNIFCNDDGDDELCLFSVAKASNKRGRERNFESFSFLLLAFVYLCFEQCKWVL